MSEREIRHMRPRIKTGTRTDASVRARLLAGKARPSSGGGGGSGEGSRGGKIIGHTGSGKPIYGNANHPSHSNFTPGEHSEAIREHTIEQQKVSKGGVTAANRPSHEHHEAQKAIHAKASLQKQKVSTLTPVDLKSKEGQRLASKSAAGFAKSNLGAKVTPQVQGLGESLGGKSGLAATGKQNVKKSLLNTPAPTTGIPARFGGGGPGVTSRAQKGRL